MNTCPCGGELVEAVRCLECGKFFPEEDKLSEPDICEECLVSAASVEAAIELGEETGQANRLNPFFNFSFSADELNDIIEKHIKENPQKYAEKAKAYCLEDVFFWGMFLKRRRGHGS